MTRKIKNLFYDFFDIKRFFLVFRFIIVFFVLMFIFNSNKFTLSKYVSNTTVDVSTNLAFFIVDVGTYSDIYKVGSIIPSINPYLYTFKVSNFKDNNRTNVNMEYDIEVITTTNIPLNFKVFEGTSNIIGSGIISNDTVITDEDGMHFRKMLVNSASEFSFEEDETDYYTLWVEFPESYKHYSELYEGTLELIEIKVNARQIV